MVIPLSRAVGGRSRLGSISKSDACLENGIGIMECPDS